MFNSVGYLFCGGVFDGIMTAIKTPQRVLESNPVRRRAGIGMFRPVGVSGLQQHALLAIPFRGVPQEIIRWVELSSLMWLGGREQYCQYFCRVQFPPRPFSLNPQRAVAGRLSVGSGREYHGVLECELLVENLKS